VLSGGFYGRRKGFPASVDSYGTACFELRSLVVLESLREEAWEPGWVASVTTLAEMLYLQKNIHNLSSVDFVASLVVDHRLQLQHADRLLRSMWYTICAFCSFLW